MNCDRFRQINDALGQAPATACWCRSASASAPTAAPAERPHRPAAAGAGQMARVGADEFAVLLDGLRCRDDAERVAARLLEALARRTAAGRP
jgi:GGDEF domain-containing protein